MSRYLLRRALQCLPVLALVIVTSFGLIRLMPGDSAVAALGVNASEEDIRNERQRQGLDRSTVVQLYIYVRQLATLDLPRCRSGQGIAERVLDAFGVTLRLGLGALAVAMTVGLGLALLSARWPGRAPDWAARLISVGGVSMPVFWLAMLLVALFSLRLGWLPAGGFEPGRLDGWVLPCLSLGLIYSASLARVGRAALLEELSRPYCTAARARGRSRWGVLIDHALPNAMVPVLTVIGSQLAGLLTGAVLTETVFSLPGLGLLIYDAIRSQERYLLVSVLLFVALIFVAINFVLDVAYAWLDPRVRYVRG